MTEPLRLKLPCRWDEVDRVREAVQGYLRAQRIPGPHEDAVTMVACELSENAVKYSGQDEQTGWFTVEVEVAPKEITVEVRHPLPGDATAHLEKLDQMVQWIRGHQDPFEAYMERLKEVSGQSIDHPESGLGLVRIAYEGQSLLDFYVDEAHVLAVSAVHAL